MIRPSTIFWLLMVSVLGFSLFRVKYEVQALEDELTHVRRDIAVQQEAVHVLRAEWTYLVQADRLQALASKFLTLTPLTSAQIATIDQLPLRPPGAPPVVQPQPAPQSLVAVALPARKPGQTPGSAQAGQSAGNPPQSSASQTAGRPSSPAAPATVSPRPPAHSVSFHADVNQPHVLTRPTP